MCAGDVVYLAKNASLPITLKTREYEVFTVVPVKKLSNGAAFAPIGLINMFNSGGAIKGLKYEAEKAGSIEIEVRGCGSFGFYSSLRPKRIEVDAKEIDFGYEEATGFISFALPIPAKESYLWSLVVQL